MRHATLGPKSLLGRGGVLSWESFAVRFGSNLAGSFLQDELRATARCEQKRNLHLKKLSVSNYWILRYTKPDWNRKSDDVEDA